MQAEESGGLFCPIAASAASLEPCSQVQGMAHESLLLWRRLHFFRGWSYEHDREAVTGSPGAVNVLRPPLLSARLHRVDCATVWSGCWGLMMRGAGLNVRPMTNQASFYILR
jgi:hypothetical protein